MIEYNDRKFYDCFNNPFQVDCGSPDLNLPPIPIDNSYIPNKTSLYNPDLLPATIYDVS